MRPGKEARDDGELYEFRVDGQLTDQAREAFCDMRIEELPAGARLYGEVIDEAHLLAIMAQCRRLGLVVVSAIRIAAQVLAAGAPDVGEARAPAADRFSGTSVGRDDLWEGGGGETSVGPPLR